MRKKKVRDLLMTESFTDLQGFLFLLVGEISRDLVGDESFNDGKMTSFTSSEEGRSSIVGPRSKKSFGSDENENNLRKTKLTSNDERTEMASSWLQGCFVVDEDLDDIWVA
jgi:hypothetical protein